MIGAGNDTPATPPWLPVQSGGISRLVAWGRADGAKYLASAGRDGTIRVWNTDVGDMIGHPLRATSAIQALACWNNTDGTVLTSAGSDGIFSNWNPYDGTLLARFSTDHAGGIRDITVWSAHGHQYMATGGYDGTIRTWDLESGIRSNDPLSARGIPITKLLSWKNSQGDLRLACGSDDGSFRIWAPENGDSLITGPLQAHTGAVGALTLMRANDNHTCLVSASMDGTICVWNAEHGDRIYGPFHVDSTGIRTLCSWTNINGESRLASGDLKGNIRLWDPVGGRPVGESYRGSTSSVTALACWPTSASFELISGGADGIVRVWDLATHENVREIVTGHVAPVWSLAAWRDPNGSRLAMAGADGLLRVCDPDKGTIVGQSLSPHGPGVWALTSWEDRAGERKIASGSLDGTICIWNTNCLPVRSLPGGHASSVSALAWWQAASGDVRLASAADDALIRVWDPDSGTPIGKPLTGHEGGVLALTTWCDQGQGTHLASAGSDGIRVWAPDTGNLAGKPLTALTQEVWALCSWHDADGAPRLASGDFGGAIRLWDPVTGTQIGQPFISDVGTIRALACWQDADGGTRIAAGGDSGIQIWDPDTGVSVRGWEVPGAVRALAHWRADDGATRLASGGDDGTVWLWDADKGLALRTIEVGGVSIWGLSDAPAQVDLLGRGPLVEAIVAQLRPHADTSNATAGPTVVTIEGPWGCGKTTLMDLVRQRLPQADGLAPPSTNTHRGRLTVREAARYLRQPAELRPVTMERPRSADTARRIITAWFNPWAHQSGQQIWAGLTNAIIEASQPILFPTEQEQERYWFSRNVNRIDRHALRRALQRRILSPVLGVALLTTALPLAISLAESGKPVKVFGHSINAVALALVLPAVILIAGSVHTFSRYWKGVAANYLPGDLFRGPVNEVNVSVAPGEAAGSTDPLRRAARGSLYLHQHDVAVVLNDIIVMGYDLVVFVDDLDRCGASAAAEVFEAVNLFLSSLNSDGLSARFVIGIDSSVIAAHLDQVYSGLNTPEVARQGEDPSAGWTYLRKLVQLPVIVPRVSKQALHDFVDAAAGLPIIDDTRALQPEKANNASASLLSQPSPTANDRSNTEGLTKVPAAGIASGLPSMSQLIPWRTMEQHPMVRELMQERLSAQPDGSIREAKRLINVWQLYARILTEVQPLDTPGEEISRARTLILLAEIIVRWPALQRYFLRRINGQSGLQRLSEAAQDETAWQITLDRLGIDASYHQLALSSLRLLLCEYDGQAVAHLAEILL